MGAVDDRERGAELAGRSYWRSCVLAGFLLLLCTSCTILLNPGQNTFGEGDPRDADHEDASDGGGDADADADSDADEDWSTPDADRLDADQRDDADVVDADGAEGLCAPNNDGNTLALFNFDDHTFESTTTVHRWQVGTDEGCRTFIPGPDGCGDALHFGGCEGSWLKLPDRPEWSDIRSIDFWLLGNPSTTTEGWMGILSRDATGQEFAGHFSVFADITGRIGARIQTLTTSVTVCSYSRISSDEWHHIEILFGPPQFQLWIDGIWQLGEGTFPYQTCNSDEDAVTPFGLAGNDEPWVLGGLNYDSANGSAEEVTDELQNVAIDHIRFRLARE